MFPLTPDQHHWLEVATEDEGYYMLKLKGSILVYILDFTENISIFGNFWRCL